MNTSFARAVFSIVAALTFPVVSLQATTLYSQYLNTTSAGSGLHMTNAIAADSFSLNTSGTVASVSFHTLECCLKTWTGTISYFFFTGSSSPSSTAFAQGSTSSYIVTNVYSDTATNVVNDYEFNLTAPVGLSAGATYWLGLEMSPGGSNPNLALVGSGVSAFSSTGSPYSWSLQSGTGAFGLFDTTFATTPEPQSVWLLGAGLGLIGLGLMRRHARERETAHVLAIPLR